MKYHVYKLMSVLALFFASAALFAKPAVSVQTKVASIDKHGNVNLELTGTLFSAKGFGLSDIVTVKLGSAKFEAPIGKNYSDVDRGAHLVRINGEEVSLAINMGNLAAATKAKEGTAVTITMKEKLGYLRTYQTRLLTKSADRADFASDAVFANFRAAKGGSLAENRLFRSCNPIESDARAPYAAALAESAGVAAVLNLADSKDAASERVQQFAFYAQLAAEGKVAFLAMGADFTDAAFAERLHEGLSFLAAQHAPYYIHGKEGRKRTGMLCSLLEAVCGATMDELVADYMQSYENYYNVRKDTVQYAALAQAVPDFFKALNGGKNVTDKNVQTVAETYLLKTVKISADELVAIRANLQN